MFRLLPLVDCLGMKISHVEKYNGQVIVVFKEEQVYSVLEAEKYWDDELSDVNWVEVNYDGYLDPNHDSSVMLVLGIMNEEEFNKIRRSIKS